MRDLWDARAGRGEEQSLEVISKPPRKLSKQHDAAAQTKKGEMDFWPEFLAHTQSLHSMKPGEGTLYHPAVPTKSFGGLYTTPRDAGNDAALSEALPHVRVVIPLVPMSFVESPARPTPWAMYMRNSVEECEHSPLVMHVCSR